MLFTRFAPLYFARLTPIVLAAMMLASPALAGPGGPYQACGILETTTGFPPCLVFTADDGIQVVPQNLAGFQAGDRVLVSGEINVNVAFVCGPALIPPLQQNTIAPCFAGCGVLSDEGTPGCTHFVSQDGERFLLEQPGGLPPGSSVFVSGAVDLTPAPCGPDMLPTIMGNIVGPCYQSNGRLVDSFGCVNFLAADGQRFELQSTSRFLAGDYVEVAGILNGEDLGPCGRALIQQNTTRPAFGGPGTMVRDESCGLVFEADQGGFNPRYRLDFTGMAQPGDRVVITGRFPATCPPEGPCVVPCIHDNTIDPLYVAAGEFSGFDGECAIFQPDTGGAPVRVEHDGGLGTGIPALVTGSLAAQSPLCGDVGLPTLRHNTADPYVDVCGELHMGFECTPLLLFGNDIFWIENLEHFALGDSVRVRGAVTAACVDLCPFPCIRYNRADVCVPGDLNRDGLINVEDSPLFVDVLLGEDLDPYRLSAADVSDDDRVDGEDISPFVTALMFGCPDCG